MRPSACTPAAVLSLALLAVACEQPPVVLSGPTSFAPGTRISIDNESATEGMSLVVSVARQSYDGTMVMRQRERIEIEVVSDTEWRVVVREQLSHLEFTMRDNSSDQTEHGPLEGKELIARRADDGWAVTLAAGEPTDAEGAALDQLGRSLSGSAGYPGEPMRPGDEAELDAAALQAALGMNLRDAFGSGSVKLRGVETRGGLRGADLAVTLYGSGEIDAPGLDVTTMQLTLQGDVFRSLDHFVDLDYQTSGEITIDGSVHDPRGLIELDGSGRVTIASHTEIAAP